MKKGQLPPGSVQLTAGPDQKIVLHPKPTDDYDDPLNWSSRRKTIHMAVVILFVTIAFMFLDSPFVATRQLREEFQMNEGDITMAIVFNMIGLGFAGVGLIPLAYGYGRRCMYLLSAIVLIGASIWQGSASSKAEYFICVFLAGVGGSVTQTLVPMTIADMFFVHQFATMNGWYLFAQGTGSFLGSAVSGKLITSFGWRGIWYGNAILLSVSFVLMLLFLEESTFVPTCRQDDKHTEEDGEELFFFNRPVSYGSVSAGMEGHVDIVDINRTMAMKAPELPPLPKTLRRRFALITKTDRPIKKRFLAPFVILVSFPAVAYIAITYGAIMAWLSVFRQVTTTALLKSPYNFDSESIGTFGVAPFIGHTLGVIVVPMLSDRWIVRVARQNNGIHHPETRLWIAIPGAAFACIGVLTLGIGVSRTAPFPALATSFGVFAFGFGVCLDVGLAYVTDCYHNMIGDALVGVSLVRNLIALSVALGSIPWIDGLSMRNTLILTAAFAAVVLLLPVSLLIWGKRARVRTAAKYQQYSLAAIPPAAMKELMAQSPFS